MERPKAATGAKQRMKRVFKSSKEGFVIYEKTVYTLGFALDNKWKILRNSLFRYTIGVNKIQQNRLFKKENDDYENKKITLDDFDWRDGGKSAGRLWL